VNETETLLDSKISSQSDSIGRTLDSLSELTSKLKSLSESADRLENDFQDKILSKFHTRNAKYERDFENELGQVKQEFENTVAQLGNKGTVQDELHSLIRDLRLKKKTNPS